VAVMVLAAFPVFLQQPAPSILDHAAYAGPSR
jgi:hypothetical protein